MLDRSSDRHVDDCPGDGLLPARVDVLIPCYNYGQFLERCVRSVLDQSIARVRVVIVDDASSDDTTDVAGRLVASDARVSYIRHPSNLGHIATFNEAIGLASADYLLLLSADDFLLPGALQRALDLLDGHPDVVLAVGSWFEFDGEKFGPPHDIVSLVPYPEVISGRAFIERSGPRNIVATATAVVRTATQRQVGGYRPELTHTSDMEMWLRLAAHGNVGIVDMEQAAYRRHPSNMSLGYDMLADLRQRAKAFEIFFSTCSDRLSDGAVLRARLHRQLAEDAVAHAHLAFNNRQREECDRILGFALAIDPAIRRSSSWLRLVAKRCLGDQLWSRLAPVLNVARRRAEVA